jgi:hypothetical protein
MMAPSRQSRGVAVSASIPPPVKGLNARDALASMAPDEAVTLDNWFPRGNDIALRGGFEQHATGFPAAVETLMEYNGAASRSLWAAAGTAIYNATASGAIGAAAVVGLGNARWQHLMFTTGGGTFLIAVNGSDVAQNYNGTAWATTPAITGVSSADLIDVTSHKSRLWFIEKNSSRAWYLGIDAIGGAASDFELGAVWRMGGKLKAIVPLSNDSGAGPDDYLAFISDHGEVAMYAGTDPDSAADWSLIGTFHVGSPIGDRSAIQVGGDAALLTDDGVVSLIKAMQLDRSAQAQAAISDRIAPLFASYAQANRTRFGWQALSYPGGNYALFNVPLPNGRAVQLVMNVLTGAWCRFTGQNAFCWGLLNTDLYFGGATAVYKADTGRSDNGAAIAGNVKTAFNYFGKRGALKNFLMMRPAFSSNGVPSPAMALNVDFRDDAPTGTPSFSISGAQWDVAKWDVDVWGGASGVNQTWTGVYGVGRCAAVRMVTNTNNATMSVSAFDVIFEPAGATAL